jgi:hypothetical protein
MIYNNDIPSGASMIKSVCVRTALLLVATAVGAGAQQRPPIRQLGAVTAKSAETFAGVASIRPLSNGSVLVNDVNGRRIVMFDPTLSKFTVIADSTSATSNAYGGRMGSLLAFRADSSVFVDPASVSMLVIDPAGKVARVMAIPRAQDAIAIGNPFNQASFDASGRLIYRTGGRLGGGGANIRTIVGGGAGGAGTLPQIPEPPDSAFIARVDLASRKVDTVGVIKIPKVKFEVKSDERGTSMTSLINPLPVVDDWVVTSDGALAFVRGKDYHVDWLNPDGTKVTSAKIPFDWQRLTDEDKIAFIDSVKAARERQGANAPNPTGAPVIGGGGAPNVQIFMNTAPGGGPGGPGGPGGAAPAQPQVQMNFVPPTDLPDYKPPFFANSTRADAEGNLWIRTIPTSAIPGGPVYDVINRKGEIIERVQIPVGRTIAAFGANGAVYLVNRDGTTATIEKATVR